MEPYGSENFKPLLLQLQYSFQPNFFYLFPVTVLTKLWNFNFGIFCKKIEIFLNMAPYGGENSKRSCCSLILLRPNFFWMFPETIHTKLASWNFEIYDKNII